MESSRFQDKLLLIRLKKKDPEAFAEVYDLYVTPIYRFIYFKVSSRHDAEDLTSEVFLKLWQYVTQSDEEIENLRAFIYQSARNIVVDFYRKSARRDITQDTELLLNISDEKQQSLLAQVEVSLEMKTVERVLRQMKDEYREVIILRFIEELSIAEIARVLNKSKGSVRVLLHRALRVTKDLLKTNKKKTNRKANAK